MFALSKVPHAILCAALAPIGCTSAPAAPAEESPAGEPPALALTAGELSADVLRLFTKPEIAAGEDRSLAGTTWSVDQRRTLYRFMSEPVAVGARMEARVELHLPLDEVFDIAGRGVVVKPAGIDRYLVRSGAGGFEWLTGAAAVASFITRPDLATFCGTRTLMFEGSINVGGVDLRQAMGAIHLVPRGARVHFSDCPFFTVGWQGLDPIPALLCKRQECAVTIGGFLLKKRTLYTGWCTPTPGSPHLCFCSPV